MIWLGNAATALWYRIRRGGWCTHPAMGRWMIYDGGRFKARRCPDCHRWESTL